MKEGEKEIMEDQFFDSLYGNMEVLEREAGSLSDEARIKAAAEPLLDWYRKNARILPWRESPTPYHVWISEIMLQQTRVTAVISYYKRFLDELPDLKALAEVEEEKLLKLWEGLGYYNRARNLKKAAQEAVLNYHGELPASYEKLLSLSGIGSYTAGAIASIAYGIPVPAVDGNVLRVISRLLASRKDIMKQSVKKQMEYLLKEVMPKEAPGEFNQALMEVGAMVCIPNGEPHCGECPLRGLCLAKHLNLTEVIPVKTPKKARKIEKKTILAVESRGRLLLRKRPETGLLAGLYEFPNVQGHLTEKQACDFLEVEEGEILTLEKMPETKHIFTHVEWQMTGYYLKLSGEKKAEEKMSAQTQGEFVEKSVTEKEYAVPGAFKAYMQIAQLKK